MSKLIALARFYGRHAPFEKGKHALSRYVTSIWPDDLDQHQLVELMYCSANIEVDVRTHMGRLIYLTGGYEHRDMRAVSSILGKGDIFVDCGAHIGLYTVLAAALVGPQGSVAAIEPSSESRRTLLNNIALNGFKNVTVFPVAVGDQKRDAVPLYLPTGDNPGSTSVHPVNSKLRVSSETTPMTTLDDLLPEGRSGSQQAMVVKMDVEGSEPAVLRGFSRTLASGKPIVMVELNDEALAAASSDRSVIFAFFSDRRYTPWLATKSGSLRSLTAAERENYQGNVWFRKH